jgi:hypothetical protein
MGRHGAGSETEDLETPAVVPPPPTYVSTPSQINWVTRMAIWDPVPLQAAAGRATRLRGSDV